MKNFGQRLYLTGVGAETTEEALRELIFKYTHQIPVRVDRVDLDTALPAYLIEFDSLADGELQNIVTRIHGLYWHEQTVVAHVM